MLDREKINKLVAETLWHFGRIEYNIKVIEMNLKENNIDDLAADVRKCRDELYDSNFYEDVVDTMKNVFEEMEVTAEDE